MLDQITITAETPAGNLDLAGPEGPFLLIDANGLADWLADATTGSSTVYHRGFLIYDRSETASRLPAKQRAELLILADFAWQMAKKGRLQLLQRKLGVDRYEYIAVKAKPAKAKR